MKQTRPYIITALCLQMVLGAILLSCSTENDEYKKDSPSAENPPYTPRRGTARYGLSGGQNLSPQ